MTPPVPLVRGTAPWTASTQWLLFPRDADSVNAQVTKSVTRWGTEGLRQRRYPTRLYGGYVSLHPRERTLM